jgi:flagellar hook assembly protein FlgD
MNAWIKSAVVVLVGMGLSAAALGQCKGEAKAAAKEGGACCQKSAQMAKGEGCQKACDPAKCAEKALAAAGAPTLAYQVGDKRVECPKQATELAGGDEAKVHYLVAEKEFCSKPEAMQAYETALNDYLGSITTVRYNVGGKCVPCPDAAASMAKASNESVKFRVASYTFADKSEAERAANVAKEAAEKVVMKRIVDGKEEVCQKTCGAKGEAVAGKTCNKGGDTAVAAKAEGNKSSCGAKTEGATLAAGKTCDKSAKCEYVVGDTKMCCPVEAGVALAKARILAAQQAVEEYAAAHNGSKEVAAGV